MFIRVGYSVIYVLSFFVVVGTGLWVYYRYDERSRLPLVANLGLDTAWVGVAAAALWVQEPLANRVLFTLGGVIGLSIIPVWLWFVLEYTNAFAERKRRLLGVASGAFLLFAVALVTNPLHGVYYTAVSVVAAPFPYVVTEWGPLGVAALGYVGVVSLGGVGLLARLFVGSRYRSSMSALLIVVGAGLAVLPTAASVVGATPLPGYNHAPLGVPAYAVFAAAAAFGTGLPDLSTVARTRLVAEMSDGVVAVDADGVVVDHNPAAEALADAEATALGDTDRVVGIPFEEAFPLLAAADTGDRSADGGTSRQGTRVVEGGEQPIVSTVRDGVTRYYSVRVTPLTERGARVGRLVVTRDVTGLEEVRKRLERQNERLDRFASVLTHEIRNPLTLLDGYLTQLETDLPELDDRTREYFENVRTASDRIEAIVADLYQLADSGQPVDEMEPVDLDTAAGAARAAVAGDLPVTVTDDVTVLADRGVLQTLLENLFRNAVDHAGPDPTVTVGATDDGFYVADDGPGIPADRRERVFEYGHTDADGSGIGLALVRTLADAHGWTVRIEEAASGGARFEFGGVRRQFASEAHESESAAGGDA